MKDVKNYEGLYAVTSCGKIWSYKYKKFLKPKCEKNGYMRVYMRQVSTWKRLDKYVHRLVAEYFIPNPEGKKCINHKDCNRSNNHIDNLEWCTHKENNEQTIKLKHMIRDSAGKFVGNYDYQTGEVLSTSK